MNYVFDMFGVVVDWSSAMVLPEWAAYAQVSQKAFKDGYAHDIELCEQGKMKESEFWKQLGDKFKCDGKELERILAAAFREKAQLDKRVINLIEELKRAGSRIVLLSNQIPLHGRICKQSGWFDYFDEVFLSYDIGARKPAKEAYLHVLKKLNCDPQDAILIDDKKENVDAARKMGMQGIVFESVSNLREELEVLR